jgi:protein SCO1
LGYLLSALVDSASAEQFVHSPNFVLVDKRRHIRGVYDGTTSQGVNDLVQDIKLLIGEERRRSRLSM